MIPKKIHYCWFGGKELPSLAKKCIESWKKYCPDYEIIEWNENNFDINMNNYVKEAYENKKWAFVSDVARMYALYNEGGIYMDTDVEVIKNLDTFLNDEAFFSFEVEDRIQTGIIGCNKNNELIKDILNHYEKINFVKDDGSLDLTPNPVIITKKLLKKGLVCNNQYQKLDKIVVYSTEYLCPLNCDTKEFNKTKNTHVIHWFDASWVPKKQKFKSKILIFIKKIIGKKNYEKVKNLVKGEK